jgi:diguanylate cyclase (GGDEF)-like protein
MKALRGSFVMIVLATVLACTYVAMETVAHPHGVTIVTICVAISVIALGGWLYQRHVFTDLRHKLSLARRDAQRAQLRWSDRVGEAELFSKVSELIEMFTETRELESVLRGATDIIRQILDADVAVLQVYSDEQHQFFMRAESGGIDVKFSDEVVEDVLHKGMCRLINNLESYQRYSDMADAGYTSMVVAPIKRRHHPMGLLGVFSSSGRDFTGKELRILTTFSGQASLIIENAQLLRKTQDLAIRDGLTSLFNHRHFQQALEKAIAEANKEGTHLSLIMGDIDDFKMYNDTHGHFMGDMVLRTVGSILIGNTRGSDIVARYGGEEFVVILPGTDGTGAGRVAENIRANIESFPFDGEETQPGKQLTISLGVSVFPEDAKESVLLIERADKAMYHTKRHGKNGVHNWQEVEGLATEESPKRKKKDAPPAKHGKAGRKPAKKGAKKSKSKKSKKKEG